MKKFLIIILVLILASLACSATTDALTDLVEGVTDQIGQTVLDEYLPKDLLTQLPSDFLEQLPDALLTLQPSEFLTQLPDFLTQLPSGFLTPQPAVGQTGSISGLLSYPSEMIPAMMVVATNTLNGTYSYVLTVDYQGDFFIDGLTPGTYTIIAYEMTSGIPGAYSQMVPCGLLYTCTDHSLIPVTVVAGQNTPDIFPGDWYADDGTFPPKPAP